MRSLANGQCAWRWRGFNRCLDLATTTREIKMTDVILDVPFCDPHADLFDAEPAKVVQS